MIDDIVKYINIFIFITNISFIRIITQQIFELGYHRDVVLLKNILL